MCREKKRLIYSTTQRRDRMSCMPRGVLPFQATLRGKHGEESSFAYLQVIHRLSSFSRTSRRSLAFCSISQPSHSLDSSRLWTSGPPPGLTVIIYLLLHRDSVICSSEFSTTRDIKHETHLPFESSRRKRRSVLRWFEFQKKHFLVLYAKSVEMP